MISILTASSVHRFVPRNVREVPFISILVDSGGGAVVKISWKTSDYINSNIVIEVVFGGLEPSNLTQTGGSEINIIII